MLGSFRLVMTWLHTWVGVLVGFVLLVVFFFGALSVFNREIDRWVVPETRAAFPELPSFDAVLRPALERLEPTRERIAELEARNKAPLVPPFPPSYWSAWSSPREPAGVYAEFAIRNPNGPDDFASADTSIDPTTGAPARLGFAIGSDFFYPMHYSLMLRWRDLGIWIVGVSTLMLLVAIVSGVVIHKKIFKEFFAFRPEAHRQRRVLDLHNLTGVVALPFHFVFAFTGLLIFAGIYFPISGTLLNPLHEKHEAAEGRASGRPHTRAGVAAPLAPVDPMVEQARRLWAARGTPQDVRWIAVHHVGDRNSYVGIYPARSGPFAFGGGAVHFEGPTGRLIGEEPAPASVGRVTRFLTGIHLMQWEHWLLRWLFFAGGLAACVCIATGLLYFVGRRRRRHAAQGVSGARVVDALAVTAVTGMLVATSTMLVANRVLPLDPVARGIWEVRAFWLAWLASFAHAVVRTAPVQMGGQAPAWREQCVVVAALAASAAGLNWLTTGDHPVRAIVTGRWAVAGVDLVLVATAVVATLAAARLGRSHAAAAALAEATSDAADSDAEVAHG